MFHLNFRLAISLAIAIMFLSVAPSAHAQDRNNQDPTAESDVISETLKTIKEIEKLDTYLAQNKTLIEANKALTAQIAILTKQVAELTKQVATQNDSIRKQLLSLPPLVVHSKIIGPNSSMAVIGFGETSIRIRSDMKMTVPVQNGIWTLMEVDKITKDIIELNFTELGRVITIYD